MSLEEWRTIFQDKAGILPQQHSWNLQFDEALIPDSPAPGWKNYIRSTSARFRCSACARGWPSNRVMVVFHMQLINGQGTVRVRRFRQECKKCDGAVMESPVISADNIDVLLENLIMKIRIKCYHEDLQRGDRPFQNIDVNSPHEPSHCEGCRLGICGRN